MSQPLPKTHFSLNSFPLDVLQTLLVSTKIRQYFLARLMLSCSKVKEKKVKMAQSCPTLCDSMDYTVHRILQARILEWVAFPFSREIFPIQGLNPGLPHCRQFLNLKKIFNFIKYKKSLQCSSQFKP